MLTLCLKRAHFNPNYAYHGYAYKNNSVIKSLEFDPQIVISPWLLTRGSYNIFGTVHAALKGYVLDLKSPPKGIFFAKSLSEVLDFKYLAKKFRKQPR